MTSNCYRELLALLQSSEDLSSDEMVFLSSDLSSHETYLDEIEVVFESTREGVEIEFSSQKFKLFKNKQSAVNRLLSLNDFSKDILIIEDNLIFCSNSVKESIFFNNVLYWHKLKRLIAEDICTHDDQAVQEMIFLSEKLGKIQVGYKTKWVEDFYDRDLKLKEAYQIVESKISNDSDFKSFFRDNFLSISQNIGDSRLRYTETLKSIHNVIELAQKDFELFKNKFSFEEFRSELEKEREAYFKDYQSTVSDFLSKVASMPIQFGAYVVLIFKFTDDIVPLIITSVLILSWSWFGITLVNHMLKDFDYLKNKFNKNFDDLLAKSKMSEKDVEEPRKDINEKFHRIVKLLICYRNVEITFTICALFICFYFMWKIEFPNYHFPILYLARCVACGF
ncbi:MAG: hypothetical protein PHC99_06110 [Methylococcales bacterium]|nr:hypothetical protein [Methylococcales bacterium]